MANESPTHPYGDLIDTRLRVMTWNVWGRFGDWQRRHDAIAQTIANVDPDVLVLQEAWHSPSHSQVDSLAERFEFTTAFAPDHEDDEIEGGIAILSRWDIAWSDSRILPLPDGETPRNVVLAAEITGPRGPIRIFGTHLAPYFHRSPTRAAQVRAAVELIAEHQPYSFPPVLCGDFNSAPDADEIRQLTGRAPVAVDGMVFFDAWTIAGDGSPGHTISRNNPNAAPLLIPDLRWDYVFVGWPSGASGAGHPVAAWLEGTTPVCGIVPSDHYAVAVELRY